ncbi:SDR family NAD(P)-dependent oxidoreductase [Streptomyces sp. AJS327]|uniref:SDR family NAD(P)-dependent oxidoreductase n=1 Tax=Streptomyces sp. AJS327 TaxID=2545265 RepID=UPI0015E00947|nr:SDR family NAD(P)-dependent oxidoreductase [Streptomyces sp. AJS327]MBA0052381.1 SDR family NAD(P)-dependent oxidoreductase [Streptomyces sp. AJS327]
MESLYGLSALVTGGSRGLGWLLARECALRGCAVTLVARDAGEVEAAAAALRARTGRPVTGRVCDVRDRERVREVVARTADDQAGLDLVLANAGIIQVGPAEETGAEGFRDAMDTMFHGTLHTALETLPLLRTSPSGGRLALVGSVGGLFGVPHLLAYSCAKSAVGTLAEGLRAEQAAHGVSVTAVHPGLTRTGSHLRAEFSGRAEREYAWFATLAGAPLLSMDAERAAERVVTGVARRRPRLVLTPAARLAATAHGLAPGLLTRANSLLARALPRGRGTGGGRITGATASASDPRPRWLAALSARNERAADQFRERPAANRPGG